MIANYFFFFHAQEDTQTREGYLSDLVHTVHMYSMLWSYDKAYEIRVYKCVLMNPDQNILILYFFPHTALVEKKKKNACKIHLKMLKV